MARSLPAPGQGDINLTLRIPGWLLAAALALLLVFLGVKAFGAYSSGGESPFFGTPARGEVLEWEVRDGIFHARVLIETVDPVAANVGGWQLMLTPDWSQPGIPVAAAVAPAPGTTDQRMALVDLFARVPEGATPELLAFEFEGGGATISLGEARP
ncbi:MAG: hypothetical protein IT303_08375 [Dehalococcoidia bacterium]|nr:hypothetical protein [Dehalococcoidia bacterium]